MILFYILLQNLCFKYENIYISHIINPQTVWSIDHLI